MTTTKPYYDPERIAEAIRNAQGMVHVAARLFKCSPQTIYQYAKRYPDIVQRAIDEARGLMTDQAELALFKAISSGEAWAVCFYLKTQAKARGYVERMEQVVLTEAQLDELIERELEKPAPHGEAEAPALLEAEEQAGGEIAGDLEGGAEPARVRAAGLEPD